MPNKTVFVQNWEESERGWGTRPDGFTVHIDRAQRDRYVNWYNKTFNNLSEAPDEYTRVSGGPIEVEVDDALYERIKASSKQKRDDRSVIDAVHGKGRSFSMSPMRSLKESDIADIDWPTKKHEEPTCTSCHRNITDSPAGGCATPKKHG